MPAGGRLRLCPQAVRSQVRGAHGRPGHRDEHRGPLRPPRLPARNASGDTTRFGTMVAQTSMVSASEALPAPSSRAPRRRHRPQHVPRGRARPRPLQPRAVRAAAERRRDLPGCGLGLPGRQDHRRPRAQRDPAVRRLHRDLRRRRAGVERDRATHGLRHLRQAGRAGRIPARQVSRVVRHAGRQRGRDGGGRVARCCLRRARDDAAAAGAVADRRAHLPGADDPHGGRAAVLLVLVADLRRCSARSPSSSSAISAPISRASPPSSTPPRPVARHVLYYLLPNLSTFSLITPAALRLAPPPGTWPAALAYAVAWDVAAAGGGDAAFRAAGLQMHADAGADAWRLVLGVRPALASSVRSARSRARRRIGPSLRADRRRRGALPDARARPAPEPRLQRAGRRLVLAQRAAIRRAQDRGAVVHESAASSRRRS